MSSCSGPNGEAEIQRLKAELAVATALLEGR